MFIMTIGNFVKNKFWRRLLYKILTDLYIKHVNFILEGVLDENLLVGSGGREHAIAWKLAKVKRLKRYL